VDIPESRPGSGPGHDGRAMEILIVLAVIGVLIVGPRWVRAKRRERRSRRR
jgi:hypothetical protein